ncbi:MAG: type I-F CRISPR-associated helicase Cas3f [Candidatus Thiodiazotropha sp. (ex Lucinoma borealis)]|nr:type I-F CRISPR-associated helicase Cas3f [Candidatus Thiodiazotropha sp. (ex Lucinoma borealis)]MCU7868756.1 type I-F CRISPR-associated helicase Cas3f [Candidatus Thiodiazotropha sp. (ex Lucinoma borealis)]
MNVLLISQCSKRALTETRRILDQFAERRGDRTWQTPITMQGLNTLHKMLRKRARKNTAVACHWIRGKDHSELLWIVGDGRQFNAQGATPTNKTRRDILRTLDENDWHSAEDIRLLAAMAALFHDLGKSNEAFQKKLSSKKPIADAYRHEWVSLRLFEAFVGDSDDKAWLLRLVELTPCASSRWLVRLNCDGIDRSIRSPFKGFVKNAPLAQTIGWLIVSHHRMPTPGPDESLSVEKLNTLPKHIFSKWCGVNESADEKARKQCWTFKAGLPFASRHWCEHVNKLAACMLRRPQLLSESWFDNPYVMHITRMVLMLADHYYSAQKSHSYYGDKKFPLIANTHRDGKNTPNQRLDEHLIGVEVNAARIAKTLPQMAGQLARIARHKGFKRRSKLQRFRWQDKAYDLSEMLQKKSEDQGFFGVNMASTGCGKTLANGRIIYGLSNPRLGARFSIALGLRTLTLQTGEAYRTRLGLGDEDMAVLVGGAAVRELFEKSREESVNSLAGSESLEDLLPLNHYVHFEGSLEDGPLNKWLKTNRDARKLLNAPILICTIDHLIPATEGLRGGRQIAPMLRLMSSDLILDEPDDFSLEDLPALARLTHWAGMLGGRVLLSSATLPPALVSGLFDAYLAGRDIYQKNRGIPGVAANVCCAWFDEFATQSGDCALGEEYLESHKQFVTKRLSALAKIAVGEQRRRAVIAPVVIEANQARTEICEQLAKQFHTLLHELHTTHHEQDPGSGKQLSFGLIRMANINPLVMVAQALYKLGGLADNRIHLCVYHSQHPLLVRSGIESKLDRLLNRNEGCELFQDKEIRQLLDRYSEPNQIVVVLATPVAEVGRDHDYDWAIVEPSSMRSTIQLAGRVRRHRKGNVESPNMILLDTNARHLEHGVGKPAFCRPGFETKDFKLEYHHLTELLADEQLKVLDASSRIRERQTLQPQSNLVDLEHYCLRDLMLGREAEGYQVRIPAVWWWRTRANLSGHLQRKQPFRNDPLGRQRYALLLDEDELPHFYQIMEDGVKAPKNDLLIKLDLKAGPRVGFWGAVGYLDMLYELAEELSTLPELCAKRFGYVDLAENKTGWLWMYHESLGFWKET